MVDFGSLYQDGDGELFKYSSSYTCNGRRVYITSADANALRSFVLEEQIESSTEVKKFIQLGILVQEHDKNFVISSSTMQQFLVTHFLGNVKRAYFRPGTLKCLILRVVETLNLTGIRPSATETSLEKMWEFEFGQALHRCTPSSTTVMCADFGADCGLAGTLGFKIRCGDDCWGVELLTEADVLDERIRRIAPGGSSPSIE